MNKKIFIVVPVYNEGAVLRDVVRGIKNAGFENIIIIDDGSDDKTPEIQKENVFYIRHVLNRGKGAATKTGFEAAKILGADVVVTIDGDGQHYVEDIPKLTKPILEDKFDVVLGMRDFRSKEVPLLKKAYNFVGNFFTWLFYGLWVSDSQSGFRAYSRRALGVIDTKTDRYEYDSEVIREIKKHGLKFKEVPIKVRYTAYSKSKKSKQGFLNGIKTLIKMIISSQ